MHMKQNNQEVYHKAVLVREVIEALAVKPNGVYIDATFGGGTHTRTILEQNDSCIVIALDWDTIALENAEPLKEQYGERLQLVWGNFSRIDALVKKYTGTTKVDGILVDFGTSQYQIHQREGFSFANDTFLDMRMSPSHFQETAADIINSYSEKELADIFWHLGQEQRSRKIAAEIVAARGKKRITTTAQLVSIIEKVPLAGKRKIHPATKVFQALRIFVNKELENIRSFLPAAVRLLKPGGRLACISFHSLEDGMVKEFFREQSHGPLAVLKVVTKRSVQAAEDELQDNPSSRSARLRVAEYVG
jgi:16S rRNA (cytosine1402-N4)-methyltransferase